MKAYYNPEGDACWLDQEVEILAWDRDKYVTFKNSLGEVATDKLWKFTIKRSNKLWELPYGCLEVVSPVTRKESTQEIKDRHKRKAQYTAYVGDIVHEFKSLRKALSFCKANKACTFLHATFHYKNGFSSAPLLEKQDGEWYYFSQSGRVSSKTLANFCWQN